MHASKIDARTKNWCMALLFN